MTTRESKPSSKRPAARTVAIGAAVAALLAGGTWLYVNRDIPVTDAATLERALLRVDGVEDVTADGGFTRAVLTTWDQEALDGLLTAWDEVPEDLSSLLLVTAASDGEIYRQSSLLESANSPTFRGAGAEAFLQIIDVPGVMQVKAWNEQGNLHAEIEYHASSEDDWYPNFIDALDSTVGLPGAVGTELEDSHLGVTLYLDDTMETLDADLVDDIRESGWAEVLSSMWEASTFCTIEDGPTVECPTRTRDTARQEAMEELRTMVEELGGTFVGRGD